jgi:hypothetical protein
MLAVLVFVASFSPPAAAEPSSESEALIASLNKLERAINGKIDRDLDTIAFAYWSAFDIQRARRWADRIVAPVEVIKTALDIHLFTEGLSGIQTRIKRAKSTLELAALTTGFVQANAAVSQLLPGGLEVGDAIDGMVKSALAHPRDAQAFQAVIGRYLEGEGAAASPIVLVAPGASDAPQQFLGVAEVRRGLTAELARLKADLAASPPDPEAAERAARSVRGLTWDIKRSAAARQEVRLPATAGATAPNALSLGAVMALNRAWTDALGNYDHDMKIEQIVSVISLTDLGISYLTINTKPFDATGAAKRFANTVATWLDLGSFAFEYTFTTNARDQVNTLPHEMVLMLAPELANLWRLVRAVESTTREAARPAEPPVIAAASEVGATAPGIVTGDQVEITMGDGSVLKGQLEAAKVPFVSAYGTIEVETSAIISFADGRLALEDGSVLKGGFGDGDVGLSTGQGALRIPAREIMAMGRTGTPGAATEEALTATPAPAVAEGQAVLVGRVLDRFNQPVAAATVRVVGSNLRTTTDSSGNYRLPYAPGKFRVVIEKEGHDSEEAKLDLAQATSYPLEDKYLIPVPRNAGLYFAGERAWLATSPCQIELAERDTGTFTSGGVNRWVARGQVLRPIVSDGTSYFLDLSGAKRVALLAVSADGTILQMVREGGWSGWDQSIQDDKPVEHEVEKNAVRVNWGTVGKDRRVFWADLNPGVYALVSLPTVEFGRFTAGIGPTCYMFELRTSAIEALAERIESWSAQLKRILAAHENEPSGATWLAFHDQLRKVEAFPKDTLDAILQRDPFYSGSTDSGLSVWFDRALYGPARAAAQAGDWQEVEIWADRILKEMIHDPEAEALKAQAFAALRPSDAASSAGPAAEATTEAGPEVRQAALGDADTPGGARTEAVPTPMRWHVLTENARIRAAPSTAAEILVQ